MFIASQLLYLRLPKTACTHIASLLEGTIGGERAGKHGRQEWAYSDGRYLLGSIRNPWDWYVSLWAFSCTGQGQLWHRTTHRYALRRLRYKVVRDRRGTRRHFREFAQHLSKPTSAWSRTYRDADDPQGFRHWLRLMHNPERRYDLAEGYGESPIASVAGLLTHQYTRLFLDREISQQDPTALGSESAIETYIEDHWALDGIVRVENLETELLSCLRGAGATLSAENAEWILSRQSRKRNPSKHLPAAYYYDDASIDLVRRREALIVQRHEYEGPSES